MKRTEIESKVLQMPLRASGRSRELMTGEGQTSLSSALAVLRAEFDGLSIRLAREYGRESQVVMRAEQISSAVQRLEWALDREDSDPSVS